MPHQRRAQWLRTVSGAELPGAAAAVVRPDGHIAWASDAVEPGEAARAAPAAFQG